jgi:hypothetical protein
VSALDFLSPDECGPDVALVSPLRHAAQGGSLIDCSLLGKLEVRGDVEALEAADGEQVLPLGPGRALVVVAGSPAAARRRLTAGGFRVYDMTDALAALEFEGEDILRRLTELEPAQLPAAGSIGHGTPALIARQEGRRFRLYVSQELGHFVAEVVADLERGLGR